MNAIWIPVVAILGSFCVVIAVLAIGAGTKEKAAKHRTDVQLKLIERFGTASEFVAFVQSPEGKYFLGDAPRVVVRDRSVGGIRTGIILTFLGAGFLTIAFTQGDRDWFVPALIMLGLGAGFFVSSMVAMKLSRNMNS